LFLLKSFFETVEDEFEGKSISKNSIVVFDSNDDNSSMISLLLFIPNLLDYNKYYYDTYYG